MGGGRWVGFGCGRLFEFEWKGERAGAYSRLRAYADAGVGKFLIGRVIMSNLLTCISKKQP